MSESPKTIRDFPYMELGECGHIRDFYREKRGTYDLVASGCTYPGCGHIGLFRGTGEFGDRHPGLGRWNEDSQEWERSEGAGE